jgi:hypothetical protein
MEERGGVKGNDACLIVDAEMKNGVSIKPTTKRSILSGQG